MTDLTFRRETTVVVVDERVSTESVRNAVRLRYYIVKPIDDDKTYTIKYGVEGNDPYNKGDKFNADTGKIGLAYARQRVLGAYITSLGMLAFGITGLYLYLLKKR